MPPLHAISADTLEDDFGEIEAVADESDVEQKPVRGPIKAKSRIDKVDSGKERVEGEGEVDVERPRKKKRKKTAKDLGPELSLPSAGLLPIPLQVDHLARAQILAYPKLTGLELDSKRLTEGMMVWTDQLPKRELANLPAFIELLAPRAYSLLSTPPQREGKPLILVLAAAALRVADLVRICRSIDGDGKVAVAKLFARHSKLSEHIDYLKTTKLNIAVGTPGRVLQLLTPNGQDKAALGLERLELVILDESFLDVKKRSLTQIPETRQDLFEILSTGGLVDRLSRGKTKLALF